MSDQERFIELLERRIDGLLARRRRMVANVAAHHQSGRRPSASELRECRRHFRILTGQLRIAIRELQHLNGA